MCSIHGVSGYPLRMFAQTAKRRDKKRKDLGLGGLRSVEEIVHVFIIFLANNPLPTARRKSKMFFLPWKNSHSRATLNEVLELHVART